ncbi:hypothetical protein BTCBT_007499 [Bacillus thuringiensis T01-328]|uniref:Uncharacterized protein n=1 Tax=Bacillus thuringiensis T01-328 TaxID=1324966 RepID=A0AAN4HB11_BACTU|nr:hypothetical protein BTCBT_007499 [Bacillus thuringiensis T01-328]
MDSDTWVDPLSTHMSMLSLDPAGGGSKWAFDEWEEEGIGPPRVRFIKDHHLGFIFKVSSVGPDPMGSPPDLEPEYAHELMPFNFPMGTTCLSLDLLDSNPMKDPTVEIEV